MAKPTLTQQELKEKLIYDPLTGLFTRRHAMGRYAAGSIAGGKDLDGYIVISFNSTRWYAHRLAFLYMTGEMPSQVDHNNRIRADNIWKNLKASNSKEQSKNKSLSSSNKSGHTGIIFYKSKWQAFIGVNGTPIYLARSLDKDKVIKARLDAQKIYNFNEGHGT